MFTEIQYRFLRKFFPPRTTTPYGESENYEGESKLDALVPDYFWRDIVGKMVIDFGCGYGREAVAMAERGAAKVIGIDIRLPALEQAKVLAAKSGVAERCIFTTGTNEPADIILSLDSFEHFSDPLAVLRYMATLLKPEGYVWASWGWPWYHPRGGHLFAVFPWAHLIFSEEALIRWRSDFKSDGAKRFSEVEGGLNQMSIRRFISLVEQSPLRLAELDCVPIRAARFLHNRLTREILSSVVKCKLVHRESPRPAAAKNLR